MGTWLKKLAPRARIAPALLRCPPPESEGWCAPITAVESDWTMNFCYRWTGNTTVATLTELVVPGTLTEALAIFREADLVQNWLPFTTGAAVQASTKLPAVLAAVQAKVPLLSTQLCLMVHRAFIDAFGSSDGRGDGGVLLVEWTPEAEELA